MDRKKKYLSSGQDPWDLGKPTDPWGEELKEERLWELRRGKDGKTGGLAVREPKKRTKKEPKKTGRTTAEGPKIGNESHRERTVAAVAYTVAAAAAILAVSLITGAIGDTADVIADSYSTQFEETSEAVREKFYDMGYESAERANHVANRAAITVEELSRRRELEVMTATDTVFVVSDGEDNSWLKVEGEGVYAVDLMPAEFIVDNETAHVLVRAPQPKAKVDILSREVLLYENDRWIGNGSIKDGEDIARAQSAEAMVELTGDFANNRCFIEAARDQAELLIKGLVFSFNPDVPDLTVDVEFFE